MKRNFSEICRVAGVVALVLAGFPLLAMLASWAGDVGAFYFAVFYLLATRLMAAIWFVIAKSWYTDEQFWFGEQQKDPYPYRFDYNNKWQLLLFPARISGGEFAQAYQAYRQAGFKVWEGRLAAFFCGFGLSPDWLDGFNDIYGVEINYRNVVQPLQLRLLWDSLIAWIFIYHAFYFIGDLFVSIAALEAIGLMYFAYLEKLRFTRM